MMLLSSTPAQSSLFALPFLVSFPFTSDIPSSQSSVPSSVSSSSSRSFVSSSVSSSSPQSPKSSPLSSGSSSGSTGSWDNEYRHESSHLQRHHGTQKNTQFACGNPASTKHVVRNTTGHNRSELPSSEAVPIEQRQHPRRTQRLMNIDCKNSDASASGSRAPPALVRQSERKEVFVESLVDTTTQMIETIWPLSVLSCTLNSSLDSPDQALIGLRTFVQEVLRRSKTSYSTLQVALYYLVLIKSLVPTRDFTMEQLIDSPSNRAMQCGRRMFLTALILASKYLQDRNYSARAWSKISGLRTCEINANEMTFLAAIKWKLHVPEPLFNRWTDIVLKFLPSSSSPSVSPSTSVKTWRSIIPRITPDLDDPEFILVSNAKNSSHLLTLYNTVPSTLSTPPPEPLSFPYFVPNAQTSGDSYRTCKSLASNPGGSVSNRPMLPPLQCPGMLPTPAMTPHNGTLSAPAVSAYGVCGVKSSMSAAMSHVQNTALARSVLDTPHWWKASCLTSIPNSSRRASLAPSSSTVSSPESMLSDVSSRRSRSSSISSVASSTCALPQLRLAMQATRRCAQLKLSSLKEGDPSISLRSPHEDLVWDVFHSSPDETSNIDEDYFAKASDRLPRMSSSGLDLAATEQQPWTQEATTTLHKYELPQPTADSFSTTLRKRENTLLTDLSLTKNPPRSGEKPLRTTTGPSIASRKRERTSSTDLSVQSSVRELIAPRCFGDITNGTRPAVNTDTVLPDPKVAESFLLLQQDFTSWSNAKSKHARENVMPRKRTCGVSGMKENCNPNHRLVEKPFAASARRMVPCDTSRWPQ